MPEIHAARRRRAQQLVREADADAALITARPNVRYLTGLASSNAALLLPADGDALLATDFRYAGVTQRGATSLELVIERFIAHRMTVERHAELAAAADGVTTRPFGPMIEVLRMVKLCVELEKL